MKSFLSTLKTLRAQPLRSVGATLPLQTGQPAHPPAPSAAGMREAAVASACASARQLAAAGLPIGRADLQVWAGQLMAAERDLVAALSAELERTREAARWHLHVLESSVPPNFTTSD
jgi:hypothetical protein